MSLLKTIDESLRVNLISINYVFIGFPKFPGKKFYNKMDRSFVEKRMINLDIYFEEMFGEFPEIMKYS